MKALFKVTKNSNSISERPKVGIIVANISSSKTRDAEIRNIAKRLEKVYDLVLLMDDVNTVVFATHDSDFDHNLL